MANPCGDNAGIACFGDDCQKCGWNPAVAAKRLEAWKERRAKGDTNAGEAEKKKKKVKN